MKHYASPNEIKVGVIGYGGAFNMGRQHLKEMQKAGMTPVAVAEPDETRRAVAAQEFPGIHAYASVTEMLASGDIDLVTLITPHNTHAPLGLECLQAGVSVVAEKPVTVTTAECDSLIAVAKEKDLVLSTYHNRHWDGCILKALEVVKSGVLGDIVRVDASMGTYAKPKDWWRTSKSISGGLLYDWGVHLLEYTFQIITSPIKEVSGYMKKGFWAQSSVWTTDTNEDDGFALVRYESGQWSSLRISTLQAEFSPHWITITGTKGTHAFHSDRYRTSTFDENSKALVVEGPNPEGEGWKFYQNIADHLVKGEALVITPEWSRRPIHVIEWTEKSSDAGKALPVQYA